MFELFYFVRERVDREMKEKQKILSDLEKSEKLKSRLATEVDEHHSAIEHKNNLNLRSSISPKRGCVLCSVCKHHTLSVGVHRKLEQDHKEKLAAVRSELMKEMDQLKQQAGLQREELEAEVQKIREDESFLRDHLSISVKVTKTLVTRTYHRGKWFYNGFHFQDNRRLEIELLDSTEKLMEAENQVAKLQMSLDNVTKERVQGALLFSLLCLSLTSNSHDLFLLKFGDLDPSSADFFLQEERIKQLYEAQYRVS